MADARRMGKMELFAHFADKFDMKRTQVRDLFRVARSDQRGDLDAWVAAFERRREEVTRPVPSDPDFRCPLE